MGLEPIILPGQLALAQRQHLTAWVSWQKAGPFLCEHELYITFLEGFVLPRTHLHISLFCPYSSPVS